MIQDTRAEFLARFDLDTHDRLSGALEQYPNATALVCFENQALDSSYCGERSAIVVGPDNTFRSVKDCKGKYMPGGLAAHDLPSQRQYPISFVLREEFLV